MHSIFQHHSDCGITYASSSKYELFKAEEAIFQVRLFHISSYHKLVLTRVIVHWAKQERTKSQLFISLLNKTAPSKCFAHEPNMKGDLEHKERIAFTCETIYVCCQ